MSTKIKTLSDGRVISEHEFPITELKSTSLPPLIATPKSDTISLVCSCGDCRKAYATEQDGGLWIQAAHDPHHKNRVPDEVILRLARRIWWERIMGGI